MNVEGPPVRAITFDFWNTLIRLTGDQRDRRREILAEVFWAHEREVSIDAVEGALGFTRDRFDSCWRANEQYVLADAADDVLTVVGVSASPELRADLVAAWLDSGRTTPVACTEPSVAALLDELRSAGIRIGIVCDSGLMPGSVLRGHLVGLGLADRFDHMAFSDEVGVYKPDPAIFAAAHAGLGVSADETAHVGDLHRTDVLGAVAAGATAIRYRGVVDDPEADTTDTTPVIDHLADLFDVLADRV
ncbi:MAG: HAD family hydrolase [Acidimicrobiales bacterium]